MLTIPEMLLSFALIGVLGGWAMGRVGSWLGSRGTRGRAQDLDHRVRALEADLRVAQRNAEEAEARAAQQEQELQQLREQVNGATGSRREHEQEIHKLRQSLAEECQKTQSLRQELTSRAEETIRARARVREVETELGVVQAGSDAVLDEVHRLVAERNELTGRIETLKSELTGRLAAPNVTRLPVRDPVTGS